MIFTLILIVHILTCLVLIVSVLLQRGKGATMGAAFGTGGSQTVFGGSGAGNFLSRVTSICAAIFFSTSLILAYRSTFNRSVVDDVKSPPPADAAKAAPTPAPTPGAAPPAAAAPAQGTAPSPEAPKGAAAAPAPVAAPGPHAPAPAPIQITIPPRAAAPAPAPAAAPKAPQPPAPAPTK